MCLQLFTVSSMFTTQTSVMSHIKANQRHSRSEGFNTVQPTSVLDGALMFQCLSYVLISHFLHGWNVHNISAREEGAFMFWGHFMWFKMKGQFWVYSFNFTFNNIQINWISWGTLTHVVSVAVPEPSSALWCQPAGSLQLAPLHCSQFCLPQLFWVAWVEVEVASWAECQALQVEAWGFLYPEMI